MTFIPLQFIPSTSSSGEEDVKLVLIVTDRVRVGEVWLSVIVKRESVAVSNTNFFAIKIVSLTSSKV
jgi:hypothetical protein